MVHGKKCPTLTLNLLKKLKNLFIKSLNVHVHSSKQCNSSKWVSAIKMIFLTPTQNICNKTTTTQRRIAFTEKQNH